MVLRLAMRNTLRNRRRSVLTALTVIFGTMMLTVGLAWVNGVRGNIIRQAAQASGHVRIVTENFARYESLRPLDEYISGVDSLQEEISSLPGVSAAYPRIQVGMLLTDAAEEDLGENGALVVGAPLRFYDEIMGLTERLTVGRWFSESSDATLADASGPVEDTSAEDECLLGRTLAEQLDITPERVLSDDGVEIILMGSESWRARVRVVGIVDTGNGLYDKQVYLSLERAQRMADLEDGAFELLVYGSDADEATSLAETLGPVLESHVVPVPSDTDDNEEPAIEIPDIAFAGMTSIEVPEPEEEQSEEITTSALTTQIWSEKEPIKSIMEVSGAILGTIAAIIVFITALGVLNTMLMSVLERTAEIGVLRAMGMKRKTLVSIFVAEAILISMLGGIVGAGFGSGIALSLRTRGVDLGTAVDSMPDTLPVNRILYPEWEPRMAIIAASLALIMALLGSLLPAIRAMRIEPVTAMRSRR